MSRPSLYQGTLAETGARGDTMTCCIQQHTHYVGTPPAALLHALIAALHDWEPGLVKIIAAVLEAQTVVRFTHLKDGGRFINVSEDGLRVTHTRGPRGANGDDWAIATPALGDGGCVGVTVHKARYGHLVIGVIGTTAPGDVRYGNSFNHATAHGWMGNGWVYLAGQDSPGHGGVTQEWWRTGDEAALMLDTNAGTLTLKHRRLGRAFTLSLTGGAADCFVNVLLRNEGQSVEVQRMQPADFDAFLP